MRAQAHTAARRQTRPYRVVLATVLAGSIAAGCSSGGNPVFKPTMTAQHASARAEQILRATADAITPRPALEIYQPGSGTGPCLINPNDTSDKRVQVTLNYWLRGISAQDNASVAQQVLDYWKRMGYAITGTHGMGTGSPEVFAGTPADDFLISLQTSANGAMSIGASSPCIWPDGTPPPTS
jgi:hypothetical protein